MIASTLLVEAHPLLRLGMLHLLADVLPHMSIQGLDYAEIRRSSDPPRSIDLALLSLAKDDDPLDAVNELQRAYIPKWILLLSDDALAPSLQHNLPPVVSGIVPKLASADMLAASIQLVLAGGKCFGLSATLPPARPRASVPAPPPAAAMPIAPAPAWRSAGAGETAKLPAEIVAEAELLQLTPRQYEVLVLLARGYPIKIVSRRLNISVATAKAHAGTLYQRLNVRNKSEAVYAAVSRGAKLDWQHLSPKHGSYPAMQGRMEQHA